MVQLSKDKEIQTLVLDEERINAALVDSDEKGAECEVCHGEPLTYILSARLTW